jgi:DNA-binding transcriptional MerR regulator
LVYVFILVDVKQEEKNEKIKRIIKENKKKDKEIKRKDEEIKRILQEKDEEIKRIIKENRKKDKEIKRKDEIYRINKAVWPDFVGEGFEIENGVLGLERDIYLSIVKFLDSSILRKVLINIFDFLFFYLCFL